MDIKTVRYDNLIKILKEKCGNSQAELSRKLDRAPAYIWQLASKKRAIGDKIARLIEKSFGLTHGWMDQVQESKLKGKIKKTYSSGLLIPLTGESLASEEEISTQATIPVYAITAGMGRGRFVESEVIIKIVVVNQSTLGEMRLTGTGHGIVAVYADGESMEPTIPPKSIVFVDRNQRDLRDGVYLVRLEDMIYVKRIQRLPDHKLKVISDNPIYKPFDVDLKNGDDFEILGKVVRTWIERTF